MEKNLNQVAQIIESAKEVGRKKSGRNNSKDQVSTSVVMELADNETQQNSTVGLSPETINRISENEKAEKENEKEVKDPFRSSVAASYQELSENDTELRELRAKVAAKEKELLCQALEKNIPTLYADIDGVTDQDINGLISYGRSFTNNWVNDSCTRIETGVNTFRSETITRKNSDGKDISRTAYSVAVDSEKFYPTTIVGRFRSFVEVARVVGLPCYAPFAAHDQRVKSEKSAVSTIANMDNEILAKALSTKLGISYAAALDMISKK